MKGVTFCPQIYDKIEFNVPNRDLRFNELFHVPFRNTNYGQNSPVCRMVRSFNRFCNDISYLELSLQAFKLNIKSVMLNNL